LSEFGLRLSELVNLNLSDIDLVSREIMVRKEKGRKDWLAGMLIEHSSRTGRIDGHSAKSPDHCANCLVGGEEGVETSHLCLCGSRQCKSMEGVQLRRSTVSAVARS
jgi:hypothetical protein